MITNTAFQVTNDPFQSTNQRFSPGIGLSVRQIAATERRTDERVYELCVVTDKEIGIVEEATKQ